MYPPQPLKSTDINLSSSKTVTAKYRQLAINMKALKALNKDNIKLTKDCSTQVNIEIVDEKQNEVKEDVPSPKKVFKLTIFVNISIYLADI